MTDKTLTETDDVEELIPVETPPEEDKKPEDEQVPGGKDAEVDDEDDDSEDERLAVSEDDSDDEIANANRERRQKRRERQRQAKEAAQRELAMLRRTVAELSQRVAVTENHTAQATIQTLEQKLAQAKAEVQQAEFIIAKAVEAGNGDDVTAAMRIRDEAVRQAQQYETAMQARQQRPAPQVDPQVVNYAKQWMEANTWYDPQGRDRHSAVAKTIDAQLAREGYDPRSYEYWQELTARVSDAFNEGDDEGPEPARKQTPDTPRRKAPPTGKTREHAPVSTKREIYVTPERKQAMIEAGVWDDPAARQRYLKAYQAYDNGSAR